jgi:hypothetical protein
VIDLKKSVMKNRVIVHGHEEAIIYKQHYKPSLRISRFLRAVLGVIISGQSLAAHKYNYRRK